MPSIMPSVMPPPNVASKRGILKTKAVSSPTALEFSSPFAVSAEDVLFDNNTLKAMQQRRYSPAPSSDTIVSSSQSSRGNSISTDQQYVLHGSYSFAFNLTILEYFVGLVRTSSMVSLWIEKIQMRKMKLTSKTGSWKYSALFSGSHYTTIISSFL